MAKLTGLPADLDPGARRGARKRPAIESLYSHQAAAYETARRSNLILTSGTASGKSLSFNLPGARRNRAGAAEPRLLPLPDQGPGPGPGSQARRAAPAGAARGDLRRRHATRGPAGHPPPRQSRPDQPRHAQRRRPPPSQALGRLPRQPRLGRGGRGAHLPRRLRLPRRERPAPPAAGGADLRRRAALHPRLGHDRQPGRAGRAAHRDCPSSCSTTTARRVPAARSRCGTRR